MSEEKVKLRSSDGDIFEVEIPVVNQFNTIKTMLDDLGTKDSDMIIPVPNVTSSILRKTIQWADYHKNDPVRTEDYENLDRNAQELSKWDEDFLKVDQSTLFELLLAANYLDIKGLVDTTCKTIANMMRGKNPEEIRKIFNIKNDFTPQEEEQIKKENEWCAEK